MPQHLKALKEGFSFVGKKFDTLISRIEELLRRPQEIKIDMKETTDSLSKKIENQTIALVQGDRTDEIVGALSLLERTLQEKNMEVNVPEVSFKPVEKGLTEVKTAIEKKSNTDITKAIKNLQLSIDSLDLNVPEINLVPIVLGLKDVVREIKGITIPEVSNKEVVDAVKVLGGKLDSLSKKKMDFPKEFKLDKMQLGQITSSWGGVNGENLAARSTAVTNITMTDADTEYSHTFSSNTVGYFVKLRAQGVLLFFAFTTGKVPGSGDGTAYMTVPQNGMFSPINLDIGGSTIFLETGSASQVAEIQEFTL